MSSKDPNGKLLTQNRPDSGYYGSTPNLSERRQLMEVDDNSRPHSRSSRSGMNGGFGLSSSLNGSLPNIAASNADILRDGSLVVSAGISVGSPRAGRRGRLGASVTRVIKPADGHLDPVSTTILRSTPEDAEATSVRPNFSAQPGISFSSEALGVVTIGSVKDETGTHKQENGTVEQKEEPRYGCGSNHSPDHRPKNAPQKPSKPEPFPFQISVKNGNGIRRFTVKSTDTVASLLSKTETWLNMHPDQYCLNFGGKRLRKEKTLEDFGIDENSNIFVEPLRLRGG